MTTPTEDFFAAFYSYKNVSLSTQDTKQISVPTKQITQLEWPFQISGSQSILENINPWINTSIQSSGISQSDFIHLLAEIQYIYMLRGNRSILLKFIEKYSFLANVLIEAYYQIRDFFPLSLVYLAIDVDSENFGSEQLVVYISTDLDPEEAANTLKAFDKKWWLKSLKRTKGKLCITLELK
jgi:hypothetical protein